MLRLENRIEHVRDLLHKAISDLFGAELPAFPALQEDALIRRIAEALMTHLQAEPKTAPAARKPYVREKEAAEYMGVSVAALRSWRLKRSKNGPPFTHVGRLVVYPMTDLENHMRAGLVQRRP